MGKNSQKAVFIGHGSPMNIIENNTYTRFLKEYSQIISKPKKIIVISAHWLTHWTYITGGEQPAQIYDFWWFPEELYKYKYTPKWDPVLAKEIESDNIGIQIDNDRGVDHAAWAVLAHIYKDEDIQVIEISLDVDKSFEQHFELGKKLAKWRSEDILFIGSGNIIHNLGDISFNENCEPFDWAVQLDNWFKKQINEYNIENLLNYPEHLPNYRQGIPTSEHYIPLLYILGMKSPEENITTIHESIQNGSISMRSIEIS